MNLFEKMEKYSKIGINTSHHEMIGQVQVKYKRFDKIPRKTKEK